MEKLNGRRTLRGVLHNFLETVTSRYSDFDGYWVFGLLFQRLDGLRVDLLSVGEDRGEDPAFLWFASESRTKFREQIEKAHLAMDYVRLASLAVDRVAESAIGSVRGRPRTGSLFRVAVLVTSDLGIKYRCDKQVFVVPHDPMLEHRSTRRLSKPD